MTTTTASTNQRRLAMGIVAAGLVSLALAAIAPPSAADQPVNTFKGVCTGTATAGTCVLDEPEGNDTATHGTVSYSRVGDVITWTIDADDPVTEVQVCLRTSGPWGAGANVCAGSHGGANTTQFVTNAPPTVAVDLSDNGFDAEDVVYWTLHVVAGGRTLQVTGGGGTQPTTTVATTVPTTVATTVPTTAAPTTAPPTTAAPTTAAPTTAAPTTAAPTTVAATVLGTQVTNTTPSTAPPTTVAPTVLGVQVTRPAPATLAFTGDRARTLLALAGLVLVLGGLTLRAGLPGPARR